LDLRAGAGRSGWQNPDFQQLEPLPGQGFSLHMGGLEYFCNQSDSLWCKIDGEMIQLGTDEMQRMGFIEPGDVMDATVIRMEKTYPAYFGTYNRFDEVRIYLDGFSNLFLMGRNGMHRYNNQDHSMLTAMEVVDLILSGNPDKASIWSVNAEQEYHEQKS
jgi:hypothetical protein